MIHKLLRLIKGYISALTNPGISLLSRTEASSISRKAKIYRFTKIIQSSVGNYSYISPHTTVVNTVIGKFCSIASYVNIGLAKHPLDHLSSSPILLNPNNATGHSWVTNKNSFIEHERVTIGNDVWIGHGALIMGGIKIGDGAVVAAGAVVTKDVPPYAIVGGIPAKIIKYRFQEDWINSLLKLKWWDLSEDNLKTHIEMISHPLQDINLIINKISERIN